MVRSKGQMRARVFGSQREKRRPKRRYRLRRYRNELRYLRPVTPEILCELNIRAPDSAGGGREVVCFALEDHGRNDRVAELVVVAFGYDGICYVSNIRYGVGHQCEVERIPHQIDLSRLKASIAQRSIRWRCQEGNDLASQLLIRFIANINNMLDSEMGAYLQFRDAWRVAEPLWDTMPTATIQKRLKRGLEAIIQTDPDIPSIRSTEVEFYFRKESTLADYEDLRRHLLEEEELDFTDRGVFKGDKVLLTERFVALAWLAFDELQSEDLTASTLVKAGTRDPDRVGGWSSEEIWWAVPCRIPSAKSRRRARGRFRKWIRRALAHFEQRRLNSAIWDLDWAVATKTRHDARRQNLLPWATRRWQKFKEKQLSLLRRRLDQESQSDAQFIQVCEEIVDECRKFAGVIRGFAMSPISERRLADGRRG